MPFNLFDKFKEKESLVVDYSFVISLALLILIIFSYSMLAFKVYLQKIEILTIENNIASYTTDREKEYDKKYSDYRKKIQDYTTIISQHKISSNVFAFIEEKTLSEIWFSKFDLTTNANEIKLSGEAESVEILSRQIQAFERSEYVKRVSVLDSRIGEMGKSLFILNISLDPKIFSYTSNPLLLYK